MTEEKRIQLLEQIADITTDLLFCDDEGEKDLCEEILCVKLAKLGYVRKETTATTNYWYGTDKSGYYKSFLEVYERKQRRHRNDK